jgi:hypothetical protein
MLCVFVGCCLLFIVGCLRCAPHFLPENIQGSVTAPPQPAAPLFCKMEGRNVNKLHPPKRTVESSIEPSQRLPYYVPDEYVAASGAYDTIWNLLLAHDLSAVQYSAAVSL